MKTEITWSDPPESVSRRGGGPGRRRVFVDELRLYPGRWAQYAPERKHSRGTGSGFKRDFPGVEVTTRTRPDGGLDVYVRWAGGAS